MTSIKVPEMVPAGGADDDTSTSGDETDSDSDSDSDYTVENEDVKLDGRYVVWYHAITEQSWAPESYVSLCDDLPQKSVGTIGEICRIYSSFGKNISAGYFFLMREGIPPLWENRANAGGGYWSFKVSKTESFNIWTQLTAAFVGGCLTKDPARSSEITGISVSSKLSNCVMKIWNRDRKKNGLDILSQAVRDIDPAGIRYQGHKAN